MHFADPNWLLLIPIVIPVYFYALGRKSSFGQSGLSKQIKIKHSSLSTTLIKLLLSLSLMTLIIALARPQFNSWQKEQVIKTKDVIIAVDASGSMTAPMHFNGVPAEYQSKMGLGVYIVKQMASQLHHTRLGLLACDTNGLYNLWPISTNYKIVESRADWIINYTKKQGAGDNIAGPNQFGMPVGCAQGSADMFDEIHDGDTTAREVIFITDAEPPMSEKRTKELVAEYHKLHIKVVMLVVNPIFGIDDVADEMRFMKMVHGTIINVKNLDNIDSAISQVKHMSASKVVIKNKVTGHFDGYPFALTLSLLMLLSYLGLAQFFKATV